MYYHDHPGMYGSIAAPDHMKRQASMPGPFMHGQRRRMNLVAIAMSFFVPWILFTVLFAVMSFSLHYQQPVFCYFIAGLGLIVVLTLGFVAVDSVRKRPYDRSQEPTWFIFAFITCLLAWVLAIVLGDANFFYNMQPYYDVLNLNTYPSVDPSKMKGQQLMDAGRIVFTSDARLDLQQSMGFKNMDVYCVAPVTIGNKNTSYVPLDNYDFWAVGVNCCSGSKADFRCGEFNNPRAHSGLRLMRDEQRAFFRLAVQQAESAFGIKATHPLFFYWMQDPIAEVNAYQDDGLKYYLLGMFSHFSLQLFLVIVAVLAFSKLG